MFLVLYVFATFLIIPNIAPLFGRVKIDNNHSIHTHHSFTILLNRNYVTHKMHETLTEVSLRFQKEYPNLKLFYLDANFPFIDGFPLLPHLSHNDGKKIDLSFIYKDKKGNITNLKPSKSGYGVFAEPQKNEINQTQICKQKGYWQYDFTKNLTFGTNYNLKLATKATKSLIEILIENKKVKKVFIEPHLKNRFQINNSKLRFHGCQAVRHDDHIHFQIQ
ncbi:hypothetical protein [Polaribacter sp.]|uniref:hypothetical protein n=1 Tax=Polaribacter sp. TaxID=1920175 RepID=UPI003F6C4950